MHPRDLPRSDQREDLVEGLVLGNVRMGKLGAIAAEMNRTPSEDSKDRRR